jgi:AcrR family transcriptional regulator
VVHDLLLSDRVFTRLNVLVRYYIPIPQSSETSSRPRGRPRRAAARPEIIEATLELLAERGFQGATIDAIADRAGVGRNTIYRRWDAKEELIADALYELSAELDVHEGEDFSALMLDWTKDFVRLFADPLFGQILPTVLGELRRSPVFAEVYAARVVRPRYDALRSLLRQAVERGELRPDVNVELVADLLSGAPFVRLLPVGLPPVTDDYAEQLLDTVWRGIAPSAGDRGA